VFPVFIVFCFYSRNFFPRNYTCLCKLHLSTLHIKRRRYYYYTCSSWSPTCILASSAAMLPFRTPATKIPPQDASSLPLLLAALSSFPVTGLPTSCSPSCLRSDPVLTSVVDPVVSRVQTISPGSRPSYSDTSSSAPHSNDASSQSHTAAA